VFEGTFYDNIVMGFINLRRLCG